MVEMVRRTNLGESTLRRFRSGDKGVTMHTLMTIARAVGIADDIAQKMPVADAINIIEKDYKPGSPHCATDCTARKAMAEDIAFIRTLYEKCDDLYERGIAQKNKQIQDLNVEIEKEREINEARNRRWRIATVSLLIAFVAVVGFSFYLIFYDFAHPHEGLLQYLTVEQVLEYLEDAGRITR